MGTKNVDSKVYRVRLSTGDTVIMDKLADLLEIDQGAAAVIRVALRHLYVDLVSEPYAEDRDLVRDIMQGLK
jgi:hypothetical protein